MAYGKGWLTPFVPEPALRSEVKKGGEIFFIFSLLYFIFIWYHIPVYSGNTRPAETRKISKILFYSNLFISSYFQGLMNV